MSIIVSFIGFFSCCCFPGIRLYRVRYIEIAFRLRNADSINLSKVSIVVVLFLLFQTQIANSLLPNDNSEGGRKSGGGVTLGAIKILRVFRVLRPLRAINRAKGLKVNWHKFRYKCGFISNLCFLLSLDFSMSFSV